MLSAKTMDWHFLPSQLFQRQLVLPMVWPGVAMAVMAIGPKDFAVLDHDRPWPRHKHNDVILRILAAHLAGLKPRNRLCTRDQARRSPP